MPYLHSYFVDVICIYCGAGIKLVCGMWLVISHATNGIPIAMMRKMIARIGVFRVINARIRNTKLIMESITDSIIGILSIIICNPGRIDVELEFVFGFVNIKQRPMMIDTIEMRRKQMLSFSSLLDFSSMIGFSSIGFPF